MKKIVSTAVIGLIALISFSSSAEDTCVWKSPDTLNRFGTTAKKIGFVSKEQMQRAIKELGGTATVKQLQEWMDKHS